MSGLALSLSVIGREPVVVTVKQLREVRLLPVQFTAPPTPNLLVLLAPVIFGSVSTVWVIADDVLELRLLALLYTAVIESLPTASAVVVQVAVSGEPWLSV